MDRRDAIKSVAFLLGGALSATTIGVFLDSCNSPSNKGGAPFTEEQKQLLNEIADIIIPATTTPGAKAAGVGPFIAAMINDCYPEHAQKVFKKGLEELEESANKEFGTSYLKMLPKDRERLLEKLRNETLTARKAEEDKKAQESAANKKNENQSAGESITPKERKEDTPYFFVLLRDLTLLGYFTSEIGATQAYEYLDIPGRYDGCADLKPGQRVWATN